MSSNTSIADICKFTRNTFGSCLTEESAGQVVHQRRVIKISNWKTEKWESTREKWGQNFEYCGFKDGPCNSGEFQHRFNQELPIVAHAHTQKNNKQKQGVQDHWQCWLNHRMKFVIAHTPEVFKNQENTELTLSAIVFRFCSGYPPSPETLGVLEPVGDFSTSLLYIR